MLVPTPSWNGVNPATVARPALPSPWTSNTAGFYYVAAGGTNVGNGYPADPRSSIPLTAAAGSVIVVEGPFSAGQTSPNDFKMTGSAASPVWVMSAEGEDNTISGAWGIGSDASYVIIDGFDFDYTAAASGKQIQIAADVYGLCIRNGTLVSSGTLNGTSDSSDFNKIGITGQQGTAYGIHGNWIFSNLDISFCGNWQYLGTDPDAHGIGLETKFLEDVWVLDCVFSYCSGNGVQFVANTSLIDAEIGRRLYISNSTAHHIAQAGFWTKRGENVVFEGCTAYTLRRDTPSSPNSSGFGCQYGPRGFWVVNCTTYDAQCGFQLASSSLNETTATKGLVTITGCQFYDIRNENGSGTDWRTDKSENGGVCISLFNGASEVRVVNNTFYDYEVGVISPATAQPVLTHGNIFSGRNTLVNGGDILLEADPGGANEYDYNLFPTPYVDNGGTVWTSVAAFTKGTGNVQGTPDYVNAAGANFVLDTGSPGIGANALDAIYAEYLADFGVSIQVDINGLARPQAGGWSIGAFETSGIVLNITTLNATTLTVG